MPLLSDDESEVRQNVVQWAGNICGTLNLDQYIEEWLMTVPAQLIEVYVVITLAAIYYAQRLLSAPDHQTIPTPPPTVDVNATPTPIVTPVVPTPTVTPVVPTPTPIVAYPT